MKFSRWVLAGLLIFFLAAPAGAQFSPGCGAGFCGLQSSGGGGGGTAFNGGKSQIGVNFLQIANDYAFMNAFKGAQSWTYVDNTDVPDPSELSTNGYPVTGANAFSHSGVYTVFYVPLQTERAGNYACKWDGISNLYTGMSATVLPSATFTGSVTAGILTAAVPSATIQKGMQISTLGGIIGDQITGSAGAAGTYFVSGLTTAGSQSMTITGGSKTGSGATGNRFVFSTTDYRFLVGFSAATQTPSALQCFHVDDEAELDAGQVLGKKFRTNWAYMNAGVIRFGDWQPMNTTNQSTWATRKPVNYVFYSGQEYRSSMWAGPTTNVGDAYTATITPAGFSLVDKVTVIVRFNASASGDSSTLTVGGTTKPIRNWVGDATSAGGNTRPVAGKLASLVYDLTLDAWLKNGGDLASGNQGLVNGVPPEVMLTIATKLGAHPYVTTPYLAADPLTDYMPSLATYFRDNGPSWMVPRFEGTNETWNSAFGFFATRYGWNKAFAYWGVSNDQNNWYGKEISLLGQAISAVYSGNRTKYQVLAGVWSGSGCADATCSTSSTSGSNTRLSSALWISSGPSQSGYSNAAGVGEAYRWVTHIAMANYVTGTGYGVLQELRDGYAYVVTNAGNPTAQATLADAYADTLGGVSAIYNLNYVKAMAGKWYTWAQGNWGGSINLPLTAYEGGYSPDFSNTVWSSPITGATAANPSVLTLATTSGTRGTIAGGGNPAVVGMTLSIPMTITGVTKAASAVVTVSGFNIADVGRSVVVSGFSVGAGTGMEQLNGTWTVTAVSGQTITLNVDSTAFTTYVSGGTMTLTTTVAGVAGNSVTTDLNGVGRTYSAGLTASYVNSALYTNTLRWASKFSTHIQTQMTQHYTDMAAIPMVFPSQFNFAGPSVNPDNRLSGGVIGAGQVWGLYDQGVYATPYSPAVESIRIFNQ